MSKFQLFTHALCDKCHWVEEHLKNSKEDVEVWDAKQYVGKEVYRCISRRTGARVNFRVPGFPLLLENSEPARAFLGEKPVLERLGAKKVIISPG